MTMKSIKNLTRFTYETAAFQGWRLSISRSGTIFTKYFSDKKFGGEEQSLAAAQAALGALKGLLESSKLVNGKYPATVIRRVEKLLEQA